MSVRGRQVLHPPKGRDVIERRVVVPRSALKRNVAARTLDDKSARPDPNLRLGPEHRDAGQHLRPLHRHTVIDVLRRKKRVSVRRKRMPIVLTDRTRVRR